MPYLLFKIIAKYCYFKILLQTCGSFTRLFICIRYFVNSSQFMAWVVVFVCMYSWLMSIVDLVVGPHGLEAHPLLTFDKVGLF